MSKRTRATAGLDGSEMAQSLPQSFTPPILEKRYKPSGVPACVAPLCSQRHPVLHYACGRHHKICTACFRANLQDNLHFAEVKQPDGKTELCLSTRFECAPCKPKKDKIEIRPELCALLPLDPDVCTAGGDVCPDKVSGLQWVESWNDGGDYTCELCDFTGSITALNMHALVCSGFLLECPKCAAKLTQEDLKANKHPKECKGLANEVRVC